MFSAGAFHTPKGYQMVTPALPSKDVLEELGRFAIRLGQLEHLLKLIYKRSHENVSFFIRVYAYRERELAALDRFCSTSLLLSCDYKSPI